MEQTQIDGVNGWNRCEFSRIALHIGFESHEAFIQLFHGACQMWYYIFKIQHLSCLLLHSVWLSWISTAGNHCWAWLIMKWWPFCLPARLCISSKRWVAIAEATFWDGLREKCESEMRNLWQLCVAKQKMAFSANVLGHQQGIFSQCYTTVSIGWSVYPDSFQLGHREGPAAVINALPCRHGTGCLSAVSFPCPVLLPDISLMWLDNKEIDSDHYAALKE